MSHSSRKSEQASVTTDLPPALSGNQTSRLPQAEHPGEDLGDISPGDSYAACR